MIRSSLEDWVSVADVPRLVRLETGNEPSRQTVYNWIRKGWLKVGLFKPLRTTRGDLLACLNDHIKVK